MNKYMNDFITALI